MYICIYVYMYICIYVYTSANPCITCTGKHASSPVTPNPVISKSFERIFDSFFDVSSSSFAKSRFEKLLLRVYSSKVASKSSFFYFSREKSLREAVSSSIFEQSRFEVEFHRVFSRVLPLRREPEAPRTPKTPRTPGL